VSALAATAPDIGWVDVAVRLFAAAALGGAVGMERELREREAGLRTHVLVAVGAALFTLASAYGFHEFLTEGGNVVRADPTRIAAQIVTGIGFIGAGAILREGMSVRGITTAATLWVVAAIGLAAGAGYYVAAFIATAVVIIALWPLRILTHRLVDRARHEEKRLTLELAPRQGISPLLVLLEQQGIRVDSFTLEDQRDRRRLTLGLDRPSQQVVPLVSGLDYVIGVRWRT